MIIFKVIYFMLFVKITSTKMTSKALEGYPSGFLPECPGSEKEARISASSLQKLQFFIVNDQNLLFTFFNKTSYNYYQMKALSRHLDFEKKTVMVVIGYLDSNYYTTVGSVIGSVYKSLGYNVLLLEYVTFNAWVYPRSVRLLRPVGKHSAEMLAELTTYGLNPKKLEFIGISHGGQAISFIAKHYRRITGMNISRVTGLDPAGPCFRRNGPEDRIDASDADFVDIIHTNSEGYGMAGAVGHVDYYVNGGEFQPGDFISLPCSSFCSHTRVYLLWLGALFGPDSLIAMQCDSIQDARDMNCFDRKPFVTNVLGLKVDKSKQGIFYLMTHNVFPYGMGVKGLKRKNDKNMKLLDEYNKEDVIEL